MQPLAEHVEEPWRTDRVISGSEPILYSELYKGKRKGVIALHETRAKRRWYELSCKLAKASREAEF